LGPHALGAENFDGGPEPVNRLNLWFPLSDATLDNGCISVVPQDDLPVTVAQRSSQPEIPWDDVRRTLQSARPLPAAAGTLLGWRFHVLHWASTVRVATAPRISVSLEFLGADVTPPPEELPVIGAQRPDTLALRLYCIAKSLQRFEKGEPLLVRYLDIARDLVERYRPDDGTI
jgi:ectoine hydroxylase-related dioxygenase (phytanoyl-CoA dioxygenase family)